MLSIGKISTTLLQRIIIFSFIKIFLVLGSDLYAKISWDVSSSLSANLHYYVNSCEVKQLKSNNLKGDAEKWTYSTGNGNIKIFDKGQCAAGVVNTAMESGNLVHGKGDWKFNFRSFSFNSGGNDRQQLECEVIKKNSKKFY